ncbi:MAG: hypothetical protein L0H84_06100, partial [Pseudonocardia sp.]|nr:hypothetical protein [Pseudonocardia sp.]
YNPYGAQRPPRGPNAPFAPQQAKRPARPQLLLIAVGLLVLGALPWLAIGVALAVLPLNVQAAIDSGTLGGSLPAGYAPADIAALVRAAAVACAVVAAGYLVLVGLTFGRRNWARIVVAVLTGIFAVLLVFVLVTTLSPIVLALVVVPVAGVVLLFTRPVSAWFAS